MTSSLALDLAVAALRERARQATSRAERHLAQARQKQADAERLAQEATAHRRDSAAERADAERLLDEADELEAQAEKARAS